MQLKYILVVTIISASDESLQKLIKNELVNNRDEIVSIDYYEFNSPKLKGNLTLRGENRKELKMCVFDPISSLISFPDCISLLPNLKNLSVGSLSMQNYSFIFDIAPRIESLGFSFMPDFTTWPKSFPKLKSLGLGSKNYTMNHSSFAGFPQSLPSLNSLSIESSSLQSLHGIASALPSLTKISMKISTPTIDPAFFAHLPRSLPSLETINLSLDGLVTFAGFPEDLPRLRKIDLQGFGSSFPSLTSLHGFPSSLPSLREMSLYCDSLPNFDGFPSQVPLLDKLWCTCPSLTSLHGMPPSCPSLRSLTLHHGTLISSLRGLSPDMPRLSWLSVDNALLSRIDIPLARYPSLCGFRFAGNPLRSLHGIPRSYYDSEQFWVGLDFLLSKGPCGFPDHGDPAVTHWDHPHYTRPFAFSDRGFALIRKWLVEYTKPFKYGDPACTAPRDALYAYYAKSPAVLGMQYVHSHAYSRYRGDLKPRLTDEELDRLIHEMTSAVANYLRSQLPAEDPLLSLLSSMN